eukprot:GHVQ01018533.1.p1 GENE.GHVQ01018533.1~~GHVQ01018533.1.p1  ORF type:complete len:144 (+),score=15.17 GHVQ01018533.1:101-532(+)
MELSDLWSGCKPWTFKTVACQTWELPWWFSCLPVTLSPQGNPVQFAAAFVVAFLITNSVRSLTRLDMVKREGKDNTDRMSELVCGHVYVCLHVHHLLCLYICVCVCDIYIYMRMWASVGGGVCLHVFMCDPCGLSGRSRRLCS